MRVRAKDPIPRPLLPSWAEANLQKEGILGHTGPTEAYSPVGLGPEVFAMAAGETPGAPVDRAQATGSVGRVLLVALVLIGAALFLLFVGRERAEPYIVAILAGLAVVGVFALFAGAAGILEFAGRAGRNDLTKALVDNAGEGIAVVDAAGRVLYANRAYLEVTGAEGPEDVRPVERLFTSDPQVADAIYRLSQGAREGSALTEEIRVAGRGGGAARWLRLRVRPLGSHGRFARTAVWVVADITRERERQENTFLELQHAIDYLDHAPAGFFSVEPTGKVIYINATLAGWLGYDLAEFGPDGLKLSDLVSGQGAALVRVSPAPGEVKTEIIDLDLRRKNGQSLPVRLYHKVAFAADGTPGVSRTLVLSRARADDPGDALRAAEVRFARFFHHTPVAIATIDRDARVLRSNAAFARLFGAAEEAELKSIFAVAAERDRHRLEVLTRAALAGHAGAEAVEAELAGAPGRYARFFVMPVDEEDPEGEAAIVHAVDTSEQRTLQAQVAQAQKMTAVGQLAGGVAHDFNNMLTAIIGYADLLLANHRPTDPSFQDLMQIRQNANRAAGLVRQLLAFSRQQTLRLQVLNLSDVLSELAHNMLQRMIGEQITLEVKHGRDLWPVKADLNQFEQAIVNLAVNARDAMPAGGKLTIRTRNVAAKEAAGFGHAGLVPSDYVMIEVEDTGHGIKSEIMDKIFEPFFSTKEVGKGTGLGLSTVYGIVKQTGGYIYALSKADEGATFRILLPRYLPAADEKPALPAELEARAADLTGRGTVLLVEDEEAVRAFAARALSSRGYTVIEAATGIEALGKIDSQADKVDLVVSDVVMPEMDGPTLLKELRGRRPELKVIFISGYAEEAFKKNLPEGEKFTFLPKPFSLKELVAAVKETMAS
jgi:two-component system cell cycle sensor histidine kinase/response regulator CckA